MTPPAPRTFGPVTQTDIVRFAGAGGDFNPLHHDPARARAAGFDAPIAMGQLTAGLLAAWLTDWCGVANLRRFEVRFTAPLTIGDTVTLSGTVTSVADGVAQLDLLAAGVDGPLVTGTASVAAS
ncbi:MAG: MaoC protein dehydratase [Nocardioidaceae bacterium]|nr:MaoC protein dehydratase [Nocardioidaceae bacterium]